MATTTAAEKRERAKSAYNAFLAVCPSRQLLDRLADKWVVLILCALGGDGTGSVGEPASMRYSELSRLIASLSILLCKWFGFVFVVCCLLVRGRG